MVLRYKGCAIHTFGHGDASLRNTQLPVYHESMLYIYDISLDISLDISKVAINARILVLSFPELCNADTH